MADIEVTCVDQVKVGDFLKFEERDKSGKFSYIGEVVLVHKETKFTHPCIEMLTFDGIMGFTFAKIDIDVDEVRSPSTVDIQKHQLYITDNKPPGWAKFKKDPDKFAESKKEDSVVIVAKPIKERVLELVNANPRKKEDSLLKLAKQEIGGSDTKLLNYIKLALTKK